MSFDVDKFRSLILEFLSRGYQFSSFSQPAIGRTIYLRHDVDFSLEYAVDMARIEADLGIASTYFVMLTSNTYNPASSAGRKSIDTLLGLGHVVSLHFDPVVHQDVDKGFREEIGVLEAITGRACDFVSLHRPGVFLEDNNRRLPGVRHTYEDAFFKDITYVSDSGGAFKYGHPLEREAVKNGEPLHLLLHPIWWMTPPGTSSDKVRAWQADMFSFLNEEAAANCLTFDGRIFAPPARN